MVCCTGLMQVQRQQAFGVVRLPQLGALVGVLCCFSGCELHIVDQVCPRTLTPVYSICAAGLDITVLPDIPGREHDSRL